MTNMKADLTGEKELLAKLDKLETKSGKRVLGKAVRAGVAPIRKEVRRNMPVDEGEAKRNTATKLKFYRNRGTQIGLVGIKGKSKARWYLHLIEKGTKAHLIKPKRKKALSLGKTEEGHDRIYGTVKHPGAKAHNVLSKAAISQSAKAVAAFQQKATEEIAKEAMTP